LHVSALNVRKLNVLDIGCQVLNCDRKFGPAENNIGDFRSGLLVSVTALERVTYGFNAINMDNYLRLLFLSVKKLEGDRLIKDSLRVPRDEG
jgi:hypothetical protein